MKLPQTFNSRLRYKIMKHLSKVMTNLSKVSIVFRYLSNSFDKNVLSLELFSRKVLSYMFDRVKNELLKATIYEAILC